MRTYGPRSRSTIGDGGGAARRIIRKKFCGPKESWMERNKDFLDEQKISWQICSEQKETLTSHGLRRARHDIAPLPQRSRLFGKMLRTASTFVDLLQTACRIHSCKESAECRDWNLQISHANCGSFYEALLCTGPVTLLKTQFQT